MKNFTKSVFYSTTVLAVGVVGIFTIYNNVTTTGDAASVASISPASGQSDIGINFGEALDNASQSFEEVTSNATKTMESSASALNDMVSAAGEEVSETVGEVTNTASDIVTKAEEKPAEVISETTGTVSETVETATETVETTAEEAIPAVPEVTEESATDKVKGKVKDIIKY